MRNTYYSMVLYIKKYPMKINCENLMKIADKISLELGYEYRQLGYTLLHPDYDYRDIGVKLCNDSQGRDIFKKLEVPSKYYGQEKLPSTPTFFFEIQPKHKNFLPEYSIMIEYPVFTYQYLYVEIDIKKSLLKEKLSLEKFDRIQQIFIKYSYDINSAFVHYDLGNTRRGILTGETPWLVTINDWRIIEHSIAYREDWKQKFMDVFYMNSIKKSSLSAENCKKVRKLVGEKNFMETDSRILFKLPQSLEIYLMNRFISTDSRRKIKTLLQKENLCRKDASLLKSILRI